MWDHFRNIVDFEKVKAVVITGAGKNFCSGCDVSKIIGPLTKMSMKELLAFTRMTGDLVKAIRNCGQSTIAVVFVIFAGADEILAMASDVKASFPHLQLNSFFVKSVPYVR